jgi:diaminopimelate epimerase
MRLVRSHGLGNDYLVLETGERLDPETVRAICDRHRGVGGDGILEPIPPVGADYGVNIWNPDGSHAEKSGNGLRIYARWLADGGAGPRFTIWTGHDVVSCDVGDETIVIAMGRARVSPAETLDVLGVPLRVIPVDLGNPHAVVFVESDLDALPWRTWGPAIEGHVRFPAHTNVQFARVVAPDVELRIWERGAGETLASGSSSCAVAAAAVATGRLAAGRIVARMPGGRLTIEVAADGAVRLEGPVEVIGRIEIDRRWLAVRKLA